jgi:hypothetical protein
MSLSLLHPGQRPHYTGVVAIVALSLAIKDASATMAATPVQ